MSSRRDSSGPRLLSGVIPSLVTPRHPDESVDAEAMGPVIEHVVDAGVAGIFVVGGQGEAWTLSPAEQAAIVETAVELVDHRVLVYAGVSAPTTRQSIALARQASRAGAAAVVSMPPTTTPTSDVELQLYFSAIADSSDVPLVLYHHPVRSGREIPVNLASALSEHPNIAGLKDSSGSLSYTLQLLDAPKASRLPSATTT